MKNCKCRCNIQKNDFGSQIDEHMLKEKVENINESCCQIYPDNFDEKKSNCVYCKQNSTNVLFHNLPKNCYKYIKHFIHICSLNEFMIKCTTDESKDNDKEDLPRIYKDLKTCLELPEDENEFEESWNWLVPYLKVTAGNKDELEYLASVRKTCMDLRGDWPRISIQSLITIDNFERICSNSNLTSETKRAYFKHVRALIRIYRNNNQSLDQHRLLRLIMKQKQQSERLLATEPGQPALSIAPTDASYKLTTLSESVIKHEPGVSPIISSTPNILSTEPVERTFLISPSVASYKLSESVIKHEPEVSPIISSTPNILSIKRRKVDVDLQATEPLQQPFPVASSDTSFKLIPLNEGVIKHEQLRFSPIKSSTPNILSSKLSKRAVNFVDQSSVANVKESSDKENVRETQTSRQSITTTGYGGRKGECGICGHSISALPRHYIQMHKVDEDIAKYVKYMFPICDFDEFQNRVENTKSKISGKSNLTEIYNRLKSFVVIENKVNVEFEKSLEALRSNLILNSCAKNHQRFMTDVRRVASELKGDNRDASISEFITLDNVKRIFLNNKLSASSKLNRFTHIRHLIYAYNDVNNQDHKEAYNFMWSVSEELRKLIKRR